MQVESSATPLLTIDKVKKVQRQRIASFIGHVFQQTNAVMEIWVSTKFGFNFAAIELN